MSPVIKLDKLTKLYGTSLGVKDISLEVAAGSVFGFLGPNGAGKTTTISMLVDLIRPTSGAITIFGLDAQQQSLEIRRRIGYLSGDMALDGGLTGRQQLEFFGNLHSGVPKARMQELAKRLNCNLNKKIKTLSRGNKQKIGLISALMHNPELLILDEPTSGLDPLIQVEFNRIINERKADGKTTFISSHVLSEVQEICDQAAFIKEGKLIAVRNMLDIAEALPKRVTITGGSAGLVASLRKLAGVKVHAANKERMEITFDGDINVLLKLLVKHTVADVQIQDADLETVFLQYYGGKS